jgi:hypothetical protein
MQSIREMEQEQFDDIARINLQIWALNDKLKTALTLAAKIEILREKDNLIKQRSALLG